MEKDTAGHVLQAFRYVESRIDELDSLLVNVNPLAGVVKSIVALVEKMNDLTARVEALEGGAVGEDEEDDQD